MVALELPVEPDCVQTISSSAQSIAVLCVI